LRYRKGGLTCVARRTTGRAMPSRIRRPKEAPTAVPRRHDSPDDRVRPVIGVPPAISTIRTR